MRRLSLGLVLVVACGGGDDARRQPTFTPIDSDGHHLRDDRGRIALLRGVNVRVAGLFDVTFDDGRTALEDIPPLEASDCARMRELGFDLVRLPINWSGIEPTEEGSYDEAYLANVDAALACAADAGLLVLIDLHQDAYSKEIGEDGAPLWAIVPQPDELLEGPLADLEDRRLSPAVNDAFESFFDPTDAAGLQAAFVRMLEVVGRRWAEHPAVIGFEIFNEPIGAPAGLDPFHIAAATALRAVAPTKLIVFEPNPIRNFTDFVPLASEPFPVDGAVYAPHSYTYVFGDQTPQLEAMTKEELAIGVDNARAEADAWGVPLMIGEFGIGPDQARATDWMRFEGELHDEYLASSAYWVWKESSQGAWGLFDPDGDGWQERSGSVAWIDRLTPTRIAAADARVGWQDGVLTIESLDPIDDVHLIHVPAALADQLVATCDGEAVAVERDDATGMAELACRGRLELR